jgi:hypothetical protein
MTNSRPRVLFILKRHHHYRHVKHHHNRCSGLYNSAFFVADMLNKFCDAKIVEVVDDNDIDREVSQYGPTHVVIEALWVVPEKFLVLQDLHPSVQWIIRVHSETPFLALEGIAIDWVKRYVQYANVRVSTNSLRAKRDLDTVLAEDAIVYLPNYYPQGSEPCRKSGGRELSIGCFGAIRPLKNQLIQAIAAMNYANRNGLVLNFAINAGRVEQGEAVLKSLRALFAGTSHTLREFDWLNRQHFLDVMSSMDLAMSVSLTETFSLVTADAVSQGVPVVTSPEVGWTSKLSQADPTNASDIETNISLALAYPRLNVWLNQRNLRKYSNRSEKIWVDYLS